MFPLFPPSVSSNDSMLGCFPGYSLLTFTVPSSFTVNNDVARLSESRCAASHDFSLADQLGVEFAAIEGEEDVEVDTWGTITISHFSKHHHD